MADVIGQTYEESLENQYRDFHDHNLTEIDTVHSVLDEAVNAVEEAGIPYALIGGLAAKKLGRPRVSHDIDFFVRPDDAKKVLKAMEKHGFTTQERDPVWLFKAWKNDILVDIIFRSSSDIYFDQEVQEHVRRVHYNGKLINAISPEDLIVIKAAVHQEHSSHHWYDALSVLVQGNLDWEYLLHRAKHAPRRVLALLIYAQSKDVAVPNYAIQRLYRSIYEAPTYISRAHEHPYRKETVDVSEDAYGFHKNEKATCLYTKGRIMEALTLDERIAEHDVKIHVSTDTIVARGEVFTEEQKIAVNEVIRRISPSHSFKNLVNVRILGGPEGSEAIQ
jgi:predicted nucleotidyltransferase